MPYIFDEGNANGSHYDHDSFQPIRMTNQGSPGNPFPWPDRHSQLSDFDGQVCSGHSGDFNEIGQIYSGQGGEPNEIPNLHQLSLDELPLNLENQSPFYQRQPQDELFEPAYPSPPPTYTQILPDFHFPQRPSSTQNSLIPRSSPWPAMLNQWQSVEALGISNTFDEPFASPQPLPYMSSFDTTDSDGSSPYSTPYLPTTPRFSPSSAYQNCDDGMMLNDLDADTESFKGEPPYAKLIYDALMDAPGHRLVLRDIYAWITINTGKAKDPNFKGWQNSVRHNLSMNGVRIIVPK